MKKFLEGLQGLAAAPGQGLGALAPGMHGVAGGIKNLANRKALEAQQQAQRDFQAEQNRLQQEAQDARLDKKLGYEREKEKRDAARKKQEAHDKLPTATEYFVKKRSEYMTRMMPALEKKLASMGININDMSPEQKKTFDALQLQTRQNATAYARDDLKAMWKGNRGGYRDWEKATAAMGMAPEEGWDDAITGVTPHPKTGAPRAGALHPSRTNPAVPSTESAEAERAMAGATDEQVDAFIEGGGMDILDFPEEGAAYPPGAASGSVVQPPSFPTDGEADPPGSASGTVSIPQKSQADYEAEVRARKGITTPADELAGGMMGMPHAEYQRVAPGQLAPVPELTLEAFGFGGPEQPPPPGVKGGMGTGMPAAPDLSVPPSIQKLIPGRKPGMTMDGIDSLAEQQIPPGANVQMEPMEINPDMGPPQLVKPPPGLPIGSTPVPGMPGMWLLPDGFTIAPDPSLPDPDPGFTIDPGPGRNLDPGFEINPSDFAPMPNLPMGPLEAPGSLPTPGPGAVHEFEPMDITVGAPSMPPPSPTGIAGAGVESIVADLASRGSTETLSNRPDYRWGPESADALSAVISGLSPEDAQVFTSRFISGYRAPEKQLDMWTAKQEGDQAKLDYYGVGANNPISTASKHSTGNALDVNLDGLPPEQKARIEEALEAAGFEWYGEGDPNHWSYGPAVGRSMYETGDPAGGLHELRRDVFTPGGALPDLPPPGGERETNPGSLMGEGEGETNPGPLGFGDGYGEDGDWSRDYETTQVGRTADLSLGAAGALRKAMGDNYFTDEKFLPALAFDDGNQIDVDLPWWDPEPYNDLNRPIPDYRLKRSLDGFKMRLMQEGFEPDPRNNGMFTYTGPQPGPMPAPPGEGGINDIPPGFDMGFFQSLQQPAGLNPIPQAPSPEMSFFGGQMSQPAGQTPIPRVPPRRAPDVIELITGEGADGLVPVIDDGIAKVSLKPRAAMALLQVPDFRHLQFYIDEDLPGGNGFKIGFDRMEPKQAMETRTLLLEAGFVEKDPYGRPGEYTFKGTDAEAAP